jgi:PAS domain S-box-containing protein
MENMEVGIATNKIIYNDQYEPVDYIIINANKKFAEFFENRKSEIIESRASRTLPFLKNRYLDNFSKVLKTGKSHKFDIHLAAQDRYFSISVFRIDKNKFATVLYDITKYKKSEQKNMHLSELLDVIRKINHLMVHKKGSEELIKESCELLIRSPIINNCWIALKNKNGAGYKFFGRGFDDIEDSINNYFSRDKVLPCMKVARDSEVPVIVNNKHRDCPQCPLKEKMKDSQYAIMRLLNKDNYFGAISLAMEPLYSDGSKEKNLLKEIADDLAFALHNFAIREKQKQAEKDRELVLNNTKDLICYYDQKHRIQWANKAYIKASGTDLENFRGEKCHHILDESKEWDKCPVAKALRTGQSQKAELTSQILQNTEIKDGYSTWLISAEPVKNNQDKVIGVIEIARDITKQKETEQSLIRSEKKYRKIFNNAHDAIYLHEVTKQGLPGRFLDVNKVAIKMLGYSRKEFLNMSPKNIDSRGANQDTVEIMEELAENGEVTFEARHITQDGTHIPVQVSSVLFELEGEKRILSQVRDIREKKQAESEKEKLQEEIIQAQKLESVGKLAGGVAHDFNNILTVIQGQAQIAQMNQEESLPVNKELEQILESSDRAAELTKQLLLFSRKQEPIFRPLDLNRTITGLSKMLERLISEEIEIELNLDKNLSAINGDKGQIEQVITNLSVNARDAMEDTGKLIIRTKSINIENTESVEIPNANPGKYVVLEVEDNGTGMDKATLDKIFEPFYTTKEVGEGTGMGLSVVHGIIKNHKGWIDVDSQPGYGTVFKIFLPATEDSSKNRKKNNSKIDKHQGDSDGILVVEDRQDVLKNTAEILEMRNYKTYRACNGEEALDIFEKNKNEINIVISDVVMPGIRGDELADKLKSEKPELNIILCSGYTDNKVDKYKIESKGYQFVRKPYSISELLEAIK